jgi:hypothetical protein
MFMSRNPSSSPSQPPSGSSGPPGSGSNLKWKAGKFLLLAIGYFCVLFYPWILVSPTYNTVVAKGANTLFLQFAFDGENKEAVFLEEKELFKINYLRAPPEGSDAAFPSLGFTSKYIHANMIILLAMILASPGLRIKRRLLYLLIGFTIMYILHAFQVAAKVEYCFAHEMGPYSTTYYSDSWRHGLEYFTGFFRSFGQQFLPFAIWVILCGHTVLKTFAKPKAGAEKA